MLLLMLVQDCTIIHDSPTVFLLICDSTTIHNSHAVSILIQNSTSIHDNHAAITTSTGWRWEKRTLLRLSTLPVWVV